MHSLRFVPLGLLAGLVLTGAAQAAPKGPPRPASAWDSVPPCVGWVRHFEFVEMLSALLSGDPPDAGFGWFHPGQSRYSWDWLAKRFDTDGDGAISQAEFRGPTEFFDRLDRDHDGKLTAADFDWSEKSPLVRQAQIAERLFRRGDANSDGRLSAAEWQALFQQAAKGKDSLTPEELRDLLFPPPPPQSKGPPPGMPTPAILLRGLLLGEIGSPCEGPLLGKEAPDFNLETQDGVRRYSLSQFRGKKPVVLIFGSFT
jgi:Ca2+-binding EF-hand superfamily protein